MGRSRKDVDGSGGDPAPAPADLEEEEDDVEGQQSLEDQEEEEEEGDGEEDGEDEEEEQGDEEEASGETAEQEGVEEGSPPKLAEGYFEIEAIRRRRRRRGQLQYLVKWRGWPESANTWEPLENLKACSDMIDAFEKRSSRKRKRKITSTPSTDPNPSRGKRGRPRRSEARSLPRPPAVPKTLPCRTSSRRASNNSNKTPLGSLDESLNGFGLRVLEEGTSGVVSAGFPSQGPPLSVSLTHQQDDHHPAQGLPKLGNSVPAPPSQGGQVTGAKKRKSGCVRRFKLDDTTQEQGDHRGHTSERLGNEHVDSTEGEIVDKNKGEEDADQDRITKIIKPVRYFASIMDGVQQVSIMFQALRSDGTVALVDDKQLKAKHPLVLIDYYEQHLRYNPTS